MRKHLELATKGKVSGGGERPYGYDRGPAPGAAEEAAHLREAARRVIAGESLRSVCVDFNDRGIATSTGGAWSIQTMRRMLRSARISGRREHHGEIVAKAVWPGIISPERTPTGCAPSGQCRRAPPLRAGPPAVTCSPEACCDAGGAARPDGVPAPPDGTRRYVCAPAPASAAAARMATMAEPVESLVAEAVLYRLDTPELAAALADARKANAEADRLGHPRSPPTRPCSTTSPPTTPPRPSPTGSGSPPVNPIQARIDPPNAACPAVSPTHRIDEYAGRSRPAGRLG